VTLNSEAHVNPAGTDEETDTVTVPVNPRTGARVILEVPDEPANI